MAQKFGHTWWGAEWLKSLSHIDYENRIPRGATYARKGKVLVHRFITKDTFEERIDEMIRSKKHLADMTIANGESWIEKLSNTELREIFE